MHLHERVYSNLITLLLFHLRASLSGMSLAEREGVTTNPSPDLTPSREEIAALLDGQIGQLLGYSGEADVLGTDLLETLHPSRSSSAVKLSWGSTELPINAIELAYRNVRIGILDPNGGSACRIESNGLHAHVQF